MQTGIEKVVEIGKLYINLLAVYSSSKIIIYRREFVAYQQLSASNNSQKENCQSCH